MAKGAGKGRGGLCEPCEVRWLLLARLGRCVCTVICLFLVGGPAAICGGIYFLVSATQDGRSADIAAYNVAVAEWESTHRAAFAAAAFSFSGPQHSGVAASPLTDNSDAAAMRAADGDGEIKVDYAHLRYRVAAGSVLGSQQLLLESSGSCANPMSCTISVAAGPAPGSTLPPPSTPYPSMTIRPVNVEEVSRASLTYTRSGKTHSCDNIGWSSSSTSCSYICENKGAGYKWVNGRCQRAMLATAYCLKVSDGGVPGAAFTAAASGPACFGSNPERWTAPMPSFPAAYATLDPGMPLEVRSERDPFVVAWRLTGGSLWFGLTTAQKLGIGAGLLVVGCVLLACPCGILAYVLRQKKLQKPGAYAQMGAPGSLPFPAAPPPGPGPAPGTAIGYPAPPPQGYAPATSAVSYAPPAGYGYPPTAAGGYAPAVATPYPQAGGAPLQPPATAAYAQGGAAAYPQAGAAAYAPPGAIAYSPPGYTSATAEPTFTAVAYSQPATQPATNPYYSSGKK
eukprot:tig00020911_g15737.t1